MLLSALNEFADLNLFLSKITGQYSRRHDYNSGIF